MRDVSKANREATLGYIAASVLESLDRTTDILLERAERAEAENAALLSAVRRAMAYCDEESRGVYNTLDSAIAAQEKDAMREGKDKP